MVKNPPANAGDTRHAVPIPGLGRAPGEGNGNMLQENSMDRGTWRATVHGAARSRTQLSTLYYYTNGQAKMAGLVEEDGAYYFVYGVNGEVTVNKTTYVFDGHGLLPESNYAFGADGKMLDGFITKDDGIYYYQNGKPGRVGLNYIDGYYYFVDYGGKLFTSGTYFVWETNGYSIGMRYTFDALGRLILG